MAELAGQLALVKEAAEALGALVRGDTLDDTVQMWVGFARKRSAEGRGHGPLPQKVKGRCLERAGVKDGSFVEVRYFDPFDDEKDVNPGDIVLVLLYADGRFEPAFKRFRGWLGPVAGVAAEVTTCYPDPNDDRTFGVPGPHILGKAVKVYEPGAIKFDGIRI